MAFAILEKHGLIVLALGALLYQVHFLAGHATTQQDAWRAVVKELSAEMREDRQQRETNTKEFLVVLAGLKENARAMQSLMLAIEQSCQVDGKPLLAPKPIEVQQ
jgi:hypothetical protein